MALPCLPGLLTTLIQSGMKQLPYLPQTTPKVLGTVSLLVDLYPIY